jgi:hypothetical protein
MDRAVKQLQQDAAPVDNLTAIMEMTLNNLMAENTIDHRDFLARVDILGALGRMVMISNYTTFYNVTSFLRHYTQNWIGMPVGVPTLREIFDEKHYSDLEGGILEGLGRLFQGKVRLFVYPTKAAGAAELTTAANLDVTPELSHLYKYLTDNRFIVDIRDVDTSQLDVTPAAVLDAIQSGSPDWEKLVPAQAAEVIKREGLFGSPATQ